MLGPIDLWTWGSGAAVVTVRARATDYSRPQASLANASRPQVASTDHSGALVSARTGTEESP